MGALAVQANPLRGAVKPGTEPGLEATAYFGPEYGSTANGVHAMIVEVDVETMMVEIKRYVVVHEGILDGLCEQRTHRNGTRLACSFYA